jgi:curved DNA-binding protein CbpA
MAERTFYDILEVSSTASSETIRAACERLSAKFDPARQGNENDAAARMQYDAVKQAFVTLSNAESRAQYDRKLELRNFTPLRPVEALEPFWTLPKVVVVGLIVLAAGGFYFKHQRDQARLETEKAIAVAKVKEVEEKARVAESERLVALQTNERERAEREEAARLRRERDADVRQVQRDIRSSEITNRVFSTIDRAEAQSEDYKKRAEAARIKREEAQATAAAGYALARDKAELCRIERERYGRSLSC